MDEIEMRIIEIIRMVTGQACTTCEFDKKLTGPHFQLCGLDLTYILLEIRSAFNIEFVADDVENEKFNTIRGIVSCVKGKI